VLTGTAAGVGLSPLETSRRGVFAIVMFAPAQSNASLAGRLIGSAGLSRRSTWSIGRGRCSRLEQSARDRAVATSPYLLIWPAL